MEALMEGIQPASLRASSHFSASSFPLSPLQLWIAVGGKGAQRTDLKFLCGTLGAQAGRLSPRSC